MWRVVRSGKNRVNDPHDHAPDKNGPRHHGQVFQILADLLFQQPGWNGGDDKGDERQAQWVGQNGAVPPFPARKGGKKFHDAFAEIDRQGQDRAELNYDRVHFPKAIAEIEMQQGFGDTQMSRRADREEFGQTFYDAEQDGDEVVVHDIAQHQSAKAADRTRMSCSFARIPNPKPPEIPGLRKAQIPSSKLQRSNAPTLQRSNAPTLQRFNASTLQRFNDSTLHTYTFRPNFFSSSASEI